MKVKPLLIMNAKTIMPVGIADSHPMTDIDEEHYVIEISPIRLTWAV